MNISCIIVDKAIPGITGPAYNKCTTLAEVLAALAGGAGVDVYAVSGLYDAATESIVITLSNGSTFSIPAALLLPVLADGTTISGNGINGNPLVGYQVLYDGASGALTILPPTSAPIVIPAQSATTETAIDVQNLLGNGAGAQVTTQQLLDNLAAVQHPAATLAAGSNPALTLDPVTQVVALDLDAAGSYDNTGSGLSATTIQDAFTELAQCCPDAPLEIHTSAFADPANPTQAEAQAWIDTQGALAPGTQIIYNTTVAGDVEDPDYMWLVNPIGDAPNIKKPVCCPDPTVIVSDYELVTNGQPQTSDILAKIAADGPYAAGTLLTHIGSGTVETPNSVWQINPAGVPIRIEANSVVAYPIPVVAFADPANPTTGEAFIWAVTTGPYPPNTLFTYTSDGATAPDYVWENDASGALINLKQPALAAGAGLSNATATGLGPNIATNPAFAQITYQQNAVATTGANSSITVQIAGRYLFTASAWWASEAWTHEAGMHGFARVNGVVIYAGGRLDHSRKLPTDPVNLGVSKFLSYSTEITCILALAVGDSVDFQVIHDDSINHDLLTNAGYAWLQLEKLS